MDRSTPAATTRRLLDSFVGSARDAWRLVQQSVRAVAELDEPYDPPSYAASDRKRRRSSASPASSGAAAAAEGDESAAAAPAYRSATVYSSSRPTLGAAYGLADSTPAHAGAHTYTHKRARRAEISGELSLSAYKALVQASEVRVSPGMAARVKRALEEAAAAPMTPREVTFAHAHTQTLTRNEADGQKDAVVDNTTIVAAPPSLRKLRALAAQSTGRQPSPEPVDLAATSPSADHASTSAAATQEAVAEREDFGARHAIGATAARTHVAAALALPSAAGADADAASTHTAAPAGSADSITLRLQPEAARVRGILDVALTGARVSAAAAAAQAAELPAQPLPVGNAAVDITLDDAVPRARKALLGNTDRPLSSVRAMLESNPDLKLGELLAALHIAAGVPATAPAASAALQEVATIAREVAPQPAEVEEAVAVPGGAVAPPAEAYPYPPLDPAELSEDERARLDEVLLSRRRGSLIAPFGWNGSEVLGKWGSDPVSAEKLQCLYPGEWLNDEVINFRVSKLRDDTAAAYQHAQRVGGPSRPQPFLDARGAHGAARCYVCTTLFLTRLLEGPGQYDYNGVRRWTKRVKLDWENTDWIIIPVHLGVHWALAVADLQTQTVHYFDSMADSSRSPAYFKAILRWISDDSADKLGDAKRIDTTSWSVREYGSHEVPQQHDGCNCGVFMATFAACIAVGRTFDFDASIHGLNLLRHRFVLEILGSAQRAA